MSVCGLRNARLSAACLFVLALVLAIGQRSMAGDPSSLIIASASTVSNSAITIFSPVRAWRSSRSVQRPQRTLYPRGARQPAVPDLLSTDVGPLRVWAPLVSVVVFATVQFFMPRRDWTNHSHALSILGAHVTSIRLPSSRPTTMLSAAARDDLPVRSPVRKGPTRLPNFAKTSGPAAAGLYDLVVLGAGPGGEAAAVLAAQLGARVLVVERRKQFGGPTGLTSKAVRQAAKQIAATCDSLGGDRRRMLKKLWARSFAILKAEAEVSQAAETRERLEKNGVQLLISDAATVGAGGPTVTVRRGQETTVLRARDVIIATGSRPARPPNIPFTPAQIVDATEVTTVLCRGLPQSVGILGGGVIAVEYATVLASVGVGVTLFTRLESFMPSLPEVLRSELTQILRQNRILLVSDPIDDVESGDPEDLRCTVTCGTRRFRVDLVLHSGGRDANSEGLGLEEAGVRIEKYGRIAVDAAFQTTVPHVYAIGDVVGGGLASAASKAGRVVARRLFDADAQDEGEDDDEVFGGRSRRGLSDVPVTLWTTPEMATVGASLEDLRARQVLPVEEGGPIVTGTVRYSDLAQGRLVGGQGFVQVVAQHIGRGAQSVHRIVGVHILGAGANDLIQLAALLIHTRSSLETVANTPWAAVTLSQLLQHAADDALCRSPFSIRAQKGLATECRP